jgi:hypothetical protein
MSSTYKERMRRALQHKPVDRLPTQINYTADMGQKMADYFNVAIESLPAFLGNHMIRVDIDYPSKLSLDGRVKFDWWGVGFDVKEEGYFASVNPLADSKDLDAYPFHLLDRFQDNHHWVLCDTPSLGDSFSTTGDVFDNVSDNRSARPIGKKDL